MLAPAGDAGGVDVPRRDAVSGKPTAVGAATAIVVGLVAITPAAGFIGPMSAIALGGIAAVPSYLALQWRAKTSLDDSLDVVAAHGVGGTVGALLTGVFAQKALNGIADGALFGNPGQLLIQAAAVVAAIVYSGVVSFVLLKLIWLVLPLRATEADEAQGLDISAARRRGVSALRRRRAHAHVGDVGDAVAAPGGQPGDRVGQVGARKGMAARGPFPSLAVVRGPRSVAGKVRTRFSDL